MPDILDTIDGALTDYATSPDRHDPASVLRDVAAKRAIVAICEYEVMDEPVRHLAAVFAGRDGYREEWQPARSEA